MYNKYKSYIKEELFFRPFGHHGVGHTKRVLKIALTLAKMKQVSEHDTHLLAIAACYHDIGRKGDGVDDEHGQKSADDFLYLGLDKQHDLSYKDLYVVLDLIKYHAVDDSNWTDDEHLLLYQILKDADALDRIRFNDLDSKYLRLEESKTLIPFAENLLLNGLDSYEEHEEMDDQLLKINAKPKEIQKIESWAEKHYPETFDMKEETAWNKGLLHYKQGGFITINKLLRYSTDFNGTQVCNNQKMNEYIYGIYNLTQKKQLPNDIIVYRYTILDYFKELIEPTTKWKFFKSKQFKEGSIFKEKGFCSTTLLEQYLPVFKNNFPYSNCILKIHLPKGIYGVYYSFNSSLHPEKHMIEEYEFLLPPCTRFRIDKINQSDANNIVIECTALIE